MDILDQRKERLLTALLRAMALFGAVAYVPSIYACLREGLYMLAVIDTVAYIGIIVAIFYPKTSYQVRLFVTVSILLLVGGAVFFYTGTEGAGYIWLLCAVVISALFGRMGAIIASIFISEAFMVLYGAAAYFQLIEKTTSYVGLIAIAANFLLIALVLSLIIINLLKVLEEELNVRDVVLNFLHHRVKNNLQTVESLLALEQRDLESNKRLSVRVAAISAANELMMADPTNPAVDLYELLRGMLRPGIDTLKGEGLVLLPPERITEVSVGLSDIVESLKPVGLLYVEIFNSQTRENGSLAIIELQLSGLSADPPSIEDLLYNELLPRSWLIADAKNKKIRISIPSNR